MQVGFVYAADSPTLQGLKNTAGVGYQGSVNDNELDTLSDVPTIIGRIIGAGLAFIGTLFFVLIVYGGFIWMMARGNEQEVAKAKELITAAVIGLIIVLSAYAITVYLGERVR